MRSSSSRHTDENKKIARKQYANRQIDKFIRNCIKNQGYLKYKELVQIHDYYDIKVYG